MEAEKLEHAEIEVKSGGKKRGSGTRGRSSLRIMAVRNISDNYQLSLSTDDKKNVNIIVGRCGSGKTTLFNKIKSCLAHPEDDCGIELELSEKTDCDVDYVCVGEDETYPEDIFKRINRSGFAEDALTGIVKRTNQMLQDIHGVFDNERNLPQLKNGKITVLGSLAAGPQTILSFALLIALRKQKGVESPLIVDSGDLDRVVNVFQRRLVQMIADNTAQCLIFCSDVWVMYASPDDPFDHASRSISLYEDMKNNGILGSVYELDTDSSGKTGSVRPIFTNFGH
ncbi:MAG: ATP-binding protein [Thaumarchaeota archaeon]|nr:ATP-binding protein [Nitrososphaerota archaeon]